MKKIMILLLCITSSYGFAQNTKAKVFIECTREWLCDFDFLRTELGMVDFVRDRFIADIHIQVNTQFTSNGSEQNAVTFKGQKTYNNQNDTLNYYNSAVATDDDKRKNMVKYIKLGIIKYIAHTNAAEDIVITYNKPVAKDSSKKETKDPWNYWILSMGSSGFFNGDANYKSASVYSYLNADRETDKTKINIGMSYNYQKNEFVISPTEKIVREIPRTNAYINYIKKKNEHFGYGFFGEYNKDAFSNLDARMNFVPKVEYNFYPYKKFNSQRIVVQYGVGVQLNNYIDTTLFFKTKENLLIQEASVINSMVKPWGTVNVGVFYNSYLNDLKKFKLSFSGSVNWRIFKGFKFGIGGSYDITRNLIQLPKQGASRDEVLTQQRLLNTAYNYFFGIGFSYQFGSKFNNFINPAFKGLSWGLNF
jgi:hypothetical protein